MLKLVMESQLVMMINTIGHGTVLDSLSKFISSAWFIVPFWILTISIVLIFKWRIRKFIILSFVFASILFYVVSEIGFKKVLTQEIGIRTRPYIEYSGEVLPIGYQYTDTSFPSSHMVLTLAMLTTLVFICPSLWSYAIVFAWLMGISRVHNGMHYPSDALVGSFVGIGCGWLAVWLSKKITNIKTLK